MTDNDARTPLAADADDHEVAAWAATEAGRLLLEVRQQGLEGRELKDAGDQAAHELLMRLLAKDPQDRPSSAQEVYEALAPLLPARDGRGASGPLDPTRPFVRPQAPWPDRATAIPPRPTAPPPPTHTPTPVPAPAKPDIPGAVDQARTLLDLGFRESLR